MVFLLMGLLVFPPVNAEPACNNKDTLERAIEKALETIRRTTNVAAPSECPEPVLPRRLQGSLGSALPALTTPEAEYKRIDVDLNGMIGKLLYAQYSAKGKNKGTVIVMGGGPALSWISRGRSQAVPGDYNVIVVDYPGTGANARASLLTGPDSSPYSLGSAAQSIVEIIRQAGLTNYVLYGHSYGTAVATKTVHIIESTLAKDSGRLEAPKALILEGTIGRSFRPSASPGGVHEHDSGFVATSDRAMSLLNTKERDLVRRKISTATSDKATEQMLMAKYLHAQLSSGARLTAGLLRALIKMPADQVMACAKAFARENTENALMQPLYSENEAKAMIRAACEITGTGANPAPQFPLFTGMLKVNSEVSDICRCAKPEESGIYDTKDLGLKKVPVLYIVGGTDPNTPPWQTEYHRRQMASLTSVFNIPDGGHSEFFDKNMELRCYDRSFAAAFSGRADRWASSLKNCHSDLRYSPPIKNFKIPTVKAER